MTLRPENDHENDDKFLPKYKGEYKINKRRQTQYKRDKYRINRDTSTRKTQQT